MPSLHVECKKSKVKDAVSSPVHVADQRAARLRFGGRRVHALCLFALAPTGFRHREFRDHVTHRTTSSTRLTEALVRTSKGLDEPSHLS